LTGSDGRRHQLRFRIWRAPTGVEAELEEAGVPAGEGYHFTVLGAHDADVDELVGRVTSQAEAEVGRLYLEPNTHRGGWVVAGDEVAGRLVWADEQSSGGPFDVVVDGRTLRWEELGAALGSYEGWRFRLVLEDPCDDARPDAEVIQLVPAKAEETPVSQPTEPPTIDYVLTEFLADQEKRLAPRTFRNYLSVVDLLRRCLNNYGAQSLDPADRRRFEQEFEQDEEAFVHLFGPEQIAENLGEFLDYFMIRKVMAGEELLRTAGTVTKKLAKWLGVRGYLDQEDVSVAVERGTEAARDLPKAEKLSSLLFEQSRRTNLDLDAIDDDDYVEDNLMIEKVEPGALWFEGGIGPLKVSKAASALAQPGWSVNVVLARVRKTWQLVEAGNVYP
jgi:hypothetical protein